MMYYRANHSTLVFPIVAAITPVVRSSRIFACDTDNSSVIVIASLSKPKTPSEEYKSMMSE